MNRHEVEFPFARVPINTQWPKDYTWKPGVLTLKEEGCKTYYEAHGMGKMIITEIARIRPEGYHERVIYTRTWIDPDGNAMGKPRKLLMTSTGAFRSLIAGYRYPFEMAERERDDV